MRITITTPTGHIGSRIVRNLLGASNDLTLFARDASKLADAAAAGARIVQGTLSDADRLAEALSGADAAFFLIPPPAPDTPHWRAWQEETGRTFAAAAKQAGVSRVVFLSSVGAQHDDIGAISGLGAVEKILTAALPNVVSIRAGYFMENLFGSLPTIASSGAIFGTFDPDAKMEHVATSDIADLATRWLTDTARAGHHVVGSHGPVPLTQHEVAAILSTVLGRSVSYVRIPPAALRDALLQAGLPPLMAHGYEEMMGGLSSHVDAGDYLAEPHDSDTAGVVTLHAFAEQALRPAFEAQFASA